MDLDTGRIDTLQNLLESGATRSVPISDEEMAELKKLPLGERVAKLNELRERALNDLRGPLRPS